MSVVVQLQGKKRQRMHVFISRHVCRDVPNPGAKLQENKIFLRHVALKKDKIPHIDSKRSSVCLWWEKSDADL